MKKLAFLGVASLLLGACSYQSPTTVTPTAAPTQTATATPTAVMMKKTVTLAEENKSGQAGTAVLEETDGKVKVTIDLTGTKYKEAQPAHIHIGVCPGVGAVKYPLTSVVAGKSTTVLMVTMADLAAAGPLAINVHKSASEASVYTACGSL
mgnify:CR=1 FL=1